MGSQTSLNPYASYLGASDPVAVVAASASQLAQVLDSIGPERSTISPAPGKWSARDILCHLADCELAFGFRLRQALAEDNHVIQPFDQDGWSKPYRSFDAGSALATFTALRAWNLTLIRSLSAEDLGRLVTHPERGPMTMRTIVETMAGHDLNHLRQLNAITSK